MHQAGSTTLDGASYTYDNAGNRLSKTDLRATVTSNYAYDAIYQLLQVTQGASTTESYTYDLVGNRLSSLGVSPYQYNSSNELTSTPAATYTYDANGNTKTKVDATGTTTYTWDQDDRLTQVALPGSGGTVTFKYDPFGRRVQKSFVQGANTTTTNYLYDGIDSLDDVDQNGNVLARYNPGVWIDEPLAEIAAGTTGYYEADALGSVSSLSNSAGTLLNTYTYDSYGKLTASTGTFLNRFQYTGREFDPETGLYHYRARGYDMNEGRFISEDPIRFKAGVNFYKYVNDSPLNAGDPTGYCPPGPLPTPCRCSGSGGAPFVGVCKLECKCGTTIEDTYFTMSGLKRYCGWAGKTCPATIEGVQITGFGGDKVVLPQKCYGLQ